jgi:hypothetical protein
MAHGLELVVLARLILLRLETVNAFVSRADVELQLLAIYLHLARSLFDRVEAGDAFRELRLEMLPLQRQIFYFVLNLPDLQLSILKDEELFQFGTHGPMKVLTPPRDVNRADLLRRINRAQRLFRPRPHGDVIGQIDPTNGLAAIDIKFGRPGDIVAFRTGSAMENIVSLDDSGIRVRKKREVEVHLFRVTAVSLHRIDADGGNLDSTRFEITKTILKTPQLGVT